MGAAGKNSAALSRPPISRALLRLPAVSSSKVQRSLAGICSAERESRSSQRLPPASFIQLQRLVRFSYVG